MALPYDPVMLRFHEGRTREQPGLSAKRAWRPITAGLRRWHEQMAPDDVVRFESAAGDLLEELGYERGAAHGSGKEAASAAPLRDAFADHARARHRPIPAAWESPVS
jgi:hypothetical protein